MKLMLIGSLHNLVIPAQAGIQRGRANGGASAIWSYDSTDIALCKAPHHKA